MMSKRKRPSRYADIADMRHAERMAFLMRDLTSPYALATAAAIIEQIKIELKEIEEGLSIARQLAGVLQLADVERETAGRVITSAAPDAYTRVGVPEQRGDGK